MLSLQTQFTCAGGPKYIEKEIQLPNGSWALVVFELVEINGKVIAKAVSGRFVTKTATLGKDECLALPAYFELQNIEPLVSPFFSEIKTLLKDLSFVTSQPARAPNL